MKEKRIIKLLTSRRKHGELLALNLIDTGAIVVASSSYLED